MAAYLHNRSFAASQSLRTIKLSMKCEKGLCWESQAIRLSSASLNIFTSKSSNVLQNEWLQHVCWDKEDLEGVADSMAHKGSSWLKDLAHAQRPGRCFSMLTLLWPVVASASDISWRFSRPKNSHLWELHPIHSQEHARAKPSVKYHEMVQQEAQNISNLFPTGKSWQIPWSSWTCAAFQHCFRPPSSWAVHRLAKPYTSRGQWRQLSLHVDSSSEDRNICIQVRNC